MLRDTAAQYIRGACFDFTGNLPITCCQQSQVLALFRFLRHFVKVLLLPFKFRKLDFQARHFCREGVFALTNFLLPLRQLSALPMKLATASQSRRVLL